MNGLKPCPFCGSEVLYEVYHNVDGFDMPFMFCNWCKSMFTVEGAEGWIHGNHDGMDELRATWNRRAKDAIVRCRDCEHSRKDGTLCMLFAAWYPIAGGDEYQEIPAEVESDGFCKWGKARSES